LTADDHPVTLSSLDVHHRDAIILALQDAIEFFSAVEYGTAIPE